MGRSLTAGALGTTLSLALGALIAPATPAVAETSAAPREVTVIPQDAPTVQAQETLLFAGMTGFLHRHNQSTANLWTRYDTGETVVVRELAGVSLGTVKRAGDDSIVTDAQVPALPAPGMATVFDLAHQTWQQWAVPTGWRLSGVHDQSMVLLRSDATLPVLQLERRTFAADGSYTATPVTGLPTGAMYAGNAVASGAASIVLPYKLSDSVVRYLLLDVASAAVVEIPDATGFNLAWRVSGDTVAWAPSTGGSFHVYSRSALLGGTAATARLVQLPGRTRVAVVGDNLIGSQDQPTDTGQRFPTVSVPTAGGDATPLLPQTNYGPAIAQGPDGTALAVGGTGPTDWAVHRFSATPGAAPTDVTVLTVKDPQKNAALTYNRGLIRHAQTQVSPTDGSTRYVVYNHPLFPDSAVGTGPAVLPANTTPCATGVECVRLVDGNSYGAVYLLSGTVDGLRTLRDPNTSYQTVGLTTVGGRIVDTADTYAIVNDGATATQYVMNVGLNEVTRSGPIRGAALWYETLWTTTGTDGGLRSIHLPSGTARTVWTTVACVPTEVQTSARWIYWSCGTDGPAGVYDLTLNRNLPVPSGRASLGDGFLVQHDAATASLRLFDFHDGTLAAPVKLADLPVGSPADDRGITWAVDRHGTGVAYVDGDNAVHVLDSGVPSTPASMATVHGIDYTFPRVPETDWRHYWKKVIQPTRPLWSWEMTIVRKTTGEVVARRSGGTSREEIRASWDGRLASGAPAVNGAYRWTLTGTVTEGESAVTVGTGSLTVACGTFSFRSPSCYGGSALLGVKSSGEGHWYGEAYGAEPSGRLIDNGYTDTWCLSCTGAARTSALVPFGDYTGDGTPDLLVRDGYGAMRAYLGLGELRYNKYETTSVSLGKGWMMYRSLLAPGDLNRDGHDDLLGVDSYGKLWLYTTTGKGGINPRIQVGSGWGIYPRVIGAGDLNGDGNGDLLGVDSYGVMYRYFGNGKGGFGGRVRVFSGWNLYNAVVPIGDLNLDNRNDLVARDANGLLWFYAGLGNGSFAPRVQKGSGWNMYKIVI